YGRGGGPGQRHAAVRLPHAAGHQWPAAVGQFARRAALMAGQQNRRLALRDPAWMRFTAIGLMLTFIGLMLVMPLTAVFHEAFRQGLAVYWASITEPDALSAIRLTLLVVA